MSDFTTARCVFCDTEQRIVRIRPFSDHDHRVMLIKHDADGDTCFGSCCEMEAV